MDIHKGSWILEFLLRQPIEDWVLNRLISILPTRKHDLRLKKTILLRRICTSLLKGSITEKILDSLESIESIDRGIRISVSESMKVAYCAVAVECAAKYFRENCVNSVERIWKIRVSEIEGFGLGSEWLRESRDEIIEAIGNDIVRDNFLMKDTWKDALECVWVFLEEAVRELGPSFLEFAAEMVSSKEENARILVGNVCVMELGDGVCGMELDPPVEMEKETVLEPAHIDKCKGSSQPREKDVPIEEITSTEEREKPREKDLPIQDINSTEEREIAMPKEVGISHVVNLGSCVMGNKYDGLSTPDANKVRKDLKSSCLNLQTVVEDPLPDSLKMAERILVNMPTEQINQERAEENHNLVEVDVCNSSVDKGIEATHVGETNTANQIDRHDGTSWPGFMVRNRTAHTYEAWHGEMGIHFESLY
ncbi:uncharacterized protein LOC143849822 isoform X2 [Tasmannia lanceolata]|uniref:uncharacterized protein LOC143849822 isoform X2 n=1 Tax=Tasmannia lanceolata TaxID=3420 RepID=UPI0040632120